MKKINRVSAFSTALCMIFSQAAVVSAKANAFDEAPAICLSYINNEIPNGALYTIKCVHGGRFLTADADTNVCQRDYTDVASQQWRIVMKEDGYVKILCENNLLMALTVENPDIPDGSNIGISEYIGADTQKFKINTNGSSYYITTKTSGDRSSLNIKGKSTAEGANVHQYKYQGNSNQLFKITPADGVYSWIKGDLNFDGIIDCFDMCLMRSGAVKDFDEVMAGIADVTADDQVNGDDLILMSDFILAKEKSFVESYYTKAIETPQPAEGTRKMEYLNRGVSAVSTGNSVFVSWRLLADDDENVAFNVYRTTDNKTIKLNDAPLSGGTNYTDNSADLSKDNIYSVKAVVDGKEYETDDSETLSANSTAQCKILDIKQGGKINFV